MHGALRRGVVGAGFLGGVAFLSAVACSSGQESPTALRPLERGKADAALAKPARADLASLLGRATVPFTSKGRSLVPVARSKGVAENMLTLGMELPKAAAGAVQLHPATRPERSLSLTPVSASQAEAKLAGDGSAVYEHAFGTTDMVQSASLDELRTQLAIHDAASPDLYVWQWQLAAGLRAVARDDLATDLVDEQGVWMTVSPATITDARGSLVQAALSFDADGYSRLRVDHRSLSYPALVDFSVALGKGVKALAIVPTQIKGRVMVLLDTSGSMIWQFGSTTGTGGDSPTDGSALLCDNGMAGTPLFACNPTVACTLANGARPFWPVASSAQPSRMLASKLALQNVVNANSGLLDFGLTRYAESNTCPNTTNPAYCCNPQINGTTKGLCAGRGEYSDIPNVTNELSYNGSCGTATQGGRVLISPGASSGPQLLPWVDFVEDFCSSTGVVGGAPRNPELRGDGSTPLARSIITAREDWYRPVYDDSRQAGSQPLDDALIDCRPYVLVVMTDGDDTCSIGTVDCNDTDATCGTGKFCRDLNPDSGNDDWRCPCSTQADCNGANQDCVAQVSAQDCQDDNAECASGTCFDAVGGGDNWRCSCATNADCGLGMTCNTTNPPEVDCRNQDSRCISNDCIDLPNTPGTNYRCTCTDNSQCPATQQCTNNRCVARGVCQSVGQCAAYFEPRPRAQVQTLTDINTVNPVKTYVLGMGNPAALNQTELNAMAVNGGTTQARFASSQQEIEAAFADIVANTVKYEICNAADDNCNDLYDEGLGVYQECASALDCSGGACDHGRCVCNGPAQCGAGYTCSNETPTRFCRPSCSEGQGACFVAGVRKCGVGVGQCCVDNTSDTCTDIVPPTGTAEVCNGLDDNCNGFADENLPCQGCVPLPEVCDGDDNDCDGLVDELEDPGTPGMGGLVDVGGPCGSAVGLCTPGTAVCTNGMLDCFGDTGPFTEVCNGYDDDCDGVTDGMTRACYTGPANTENVGICRGGTQVCAVLMAGVERWGTCTGQQLPTTEICNMLDDNCDGLVDNGIPAPKPSETTGDECCGNGVTMAQCGVGQCNKGIWQCAGSVVVCANAGRATNETCDNVDNDCNGMVDNIESVGGPCLAPGGCSGTLTCDSVAMELVCEPIGSAGVEICDGTDNDCDGQIDEVDDLMVNEDTGEPGVHDWWHDPCNVPPPGHDQPPCESGRLICKNGVPKVCEGGVGPLPEVCDLKDTDCDGVADTLAACPGTNACVQGVCVEPCRGGEFPCPGGYDCRPFGGKSYCVPTTCNAIECPPGASCKNGSCTLDAAGGAGSAGGAGNVGEGGETSSSGGSGPAEGGDGSRPNPGGGADSAGSAGSSNANAGSGATGATTGEEARGIYGLVTGGGGCACRTVPVRGGTWATGLSLLLMASAFVRRRRAAKRRAAG
ncbi:MAG TPA: MopE-related protein [Polyangiaceae bacterium]|nr:MopE-related protein [Polyangiaceae bacterium]